MAKKRLYLVDGTYFVFRSFFAVRGLTSPEGVPTNAVYGFTSTLLKLLAEHKPDYVAVVFDASAETFRTEIYPEYKANRPPPPEDLVPQFSLVREVSRAFNLPTLELLGYEADDIIATLATQAEDEGFATTIVSSDKDLMQLVGGGVELLDAMKDVRLGPDEVKERLGVRPDQVVDFLALMGDSSDNIPGVPGIGKKTAAQLLERYDSLDGIYEAIDQQKGKRRQNLEENKELAYLSQRLATVCREVPLEVGVGDLAMREPDRPALSELFKRLGFRTWQRQYHEAEGGPSASARLSREGYVLVRTRAALATMVRALERAEWVAFDTETTSLHTASARLVGMSFCTSGEVAFYAPVGHTSEDSAGQLALDAVIEAVGPILSDPAKRKSAQNAKYDIQVLKKHGVEVRGLAFDTMLASYLTDPGRREHNLDSLALERLDHKTITFSEVAGSGKEQVTFDRVSLSAARDYACEDAHVVHALTQQMLPELEEAGLGSLFYDVELPLVPVLADMELRGVKVDTVRLEALSREFAVRADELEGLCRELAGEPFNLGSPKQLQEILFNKLGLTPGKRTKTGFSTDSSVLESLVHEHELPGRILEWRSLTKLKSTYTDVLPTLVHPETGRIHTTYHQAVAATGRLSSADPNLQNIPVRTEEGQRIREAFVPEPGSVLLSADYSQIELRVLAHLCGDDKMKRAFRDGADIHARTASTLFGVLEPCITREQRAVAKTVNFGILYGMSAFRLAREQGLSRAEAKDLIDRYFERYPGILSWKEETLARARETGRVETLFGRIRRLPDLKSKSHQARAAAERVAINTPIQGTAADIIKKAMIAIHARLEDEIPGAHMVLQVHDELVFEVREESVEAARELVVSEMERAVELDVPLVVDAAFGKSWLEAH